MKKAMWGGVVAVLVVLLGGYALWSASRQSAELTNSTQQPASTGNQTSSNSSGMGMPGMGNMMPGGRYKDGSYTGSVGSAAPYGQVQVKVTITGGKMTAIELLKKPQGSEETNQISAHAFPILIQEAIATQNAHVNIVSGATQDTEGFNTSLSSALQQAQS